MEMATEKTRSIAINDAMIDQLISAFEASTGIKPTNRHAVELAMRDKIEQLDKLKRSLVAKNR
ncbi:hypothetical protein M9Y82_02595 [Leptospira weilii]|uniref:hypothetical protein n=1 Tax=Leptospira weilii TaxID=28184 RepID=UPI00024872C9|nr:hypothetical protein [Leptospira weilii]MCL8265558.1 hypothetical protein [Leptospira weilii]